MSFQKDCRRFSYYIERGPLSPPRAVAPQSGVTGTRRRYRPDILPRETRVRLREGVRQYASMTFRTKPREVFVLAAARMARRSIPGTAEADVAVGIRRCIVQIQRKDAIIRPVVPIAAADKGNRFFIQTHPFPHAHAQREFDRIHPPSSLPTSLTISAAKAYCRRLMNLRSLHSRSNILSVSRSTDTS